jgi:transcriptional regulator with XRE-family HTH domain
MTIRRIHRRRPPRRALGSYPNLAAYCAETGDTQAGIAAQVGTTQAHISRILRGEVIPRSELAVRIARYAHIPLDSFMRAYLAKRGGRVA